MHKMWKVGSAASFAAVVVAWCVPALANEYSGYDCLIEPNSIVDLTTREDGVVAKIAVRRGDVIKKGQVLAQLESSVEEIAVNIARARAKMRSAVDSRKAGVLYLTSQKNRMDELFAKNAVPVYEKDKANTDLILAEADLREARENVELAQLEKKRAENILARRTITSPIDGVVVAVNLQEGESVEEHSIMTIAKVDPLNVEVVLPETLYGLIVLGTQGEVGPLIRGAQKQISSVVVVDKVIDAASNTFGVRLELENSGHAIPGGIRCDIKFNLEAVAAVDS